MDTPSTQALADSIRSSIAAEIAQTIPLLPKSFVVVLAKVLAGALILEYKYAGFSFLNMFIATASAKPVTINGKTLIPLVEWGRQLGVGDPKAATAAELDLTVVVQTQTGSVKAGSQVLYKPTGIIYVTQREVALNAATVTVRVRAALGPAGDDGQPTDGTGTVGNLQVGDQLEFANPLPNIARTATVASVVTTAADAEDIETEYRPRVLRRNQARAQGGALADYRDWAEGVETTLRAYPYTSSTPGEVDVYVEVEATDANPDGIPTSGELEDVVEAIELDENGEAKRRPVTAGVNVLAITRKSFNVTITNLDVPGGTDESSAQNSISDAVDEYLRTLEPFIVGVSVLPRADRVTQGAVAGVVHDAASALGATVSAVALFVGIDEITAYTLASGEKAKLGTATFV